MALNPTLNAAERLLFRALLRGTERVDIYYSATTPDRFPINGGLSIAGDPLLENATIQYEVIVLSGGNYVSKGLRATWQQVNNDIYALSAAEKTAGAWLQLPLTSAGGAGVVRASLVLEGVSVQSVVPAGGFVLAQPTLAQYADFSSNIAGDRYLTIPLNAARPDGVTVEFWGIPLVALPPGYYMDFRTPAADQQGYFRHDGIVNATATARRADGVAAPLNNLTGDAHHLFTVRINALAASSVLTLFNRYSLLEKSGGWRFGSAAVYEGQLAESATASLTSARPQPIGLYEKLGLLAPGTTSVADTSGNNRTAQILGI